MNRRFAKRLERYLLRLTYVAFACKLLVPAGYMPAAFTSGAPFMLCPAHFPVELLPGHAGHARSGPEPGHGDHDDHGDQDDASGWGRCALGTLAATPALAAVYDLGIPQTEPEPVAVISCLPAPRRHTAQFRARAPPRSLS